MLPSLLSLLHMHSKREVRNCEKDWKMGYWICSLLKVFVFIFFCVRMCLLKELPGCFVIISVMKVWIDISYPLIWKCSHSVICYTYCYIFNMLFLTTGLPMCKFLFTSLSFFYCTRQHGAIFTVWACNNCTSCKSDCFLFCLFCILWVRQWTSHMTIEAVAKCVSFNPTGTHTSLVYMPPVNM